MKNYLIETAVTGLVITSASMLAYAGVRLAQKFFGPLEVKNVD